MKQFLAIYIGSPSGSKATEWSGMTEAQRQERMQKGMAAWYAWSKKNESAIVVQGGPLGKTKLADAHGISDTKNKMTAYTVVQAENHEAAAKLFLDHPHFTIFPGDSVEIMETLPIPGM